MKSTGVIRKIDDLGRLVIPKEIRRNLKVSEGDNLEIYINDDEIILKKYSGFDSIVTISKKLVDSFYKLFKCSIMITDKDKVISVSKDIYSNYQDLEITSSIKEYMNNRIEIVVNDINIVSGGNKSKCFIFPIISNSDVVGSIILINNSFSNDILGSTRLIGEFLSKNIED